MPDEQAAVDELEAARDRHHARQAGRDALAIIRLFAADDTDGAECGALDVEAPRAVAYVACCYAAGILQAFADVVEDQGAVEMVLQRLTDQIEEMTFDA